MTIDWQESQGPRKSGDWEMGSRCDDFLEQDSMRNKVKSLSPVQLFATPWSVASQTPPSMGFSRQEYWSGLSFPSSGDLPDPGIKPWSPTLQADSLPSESPGKIYPEPKVAES